MIGAHILLRIADDLQSLISICAWLCKYRIHATGLTMNAAYVAKMWHIFVAGAVGYLIVCPNGHSSTEVGSEIPPHNNLTAVMEKLVKMAPKIDALHLVKKQLIKYHLSYDILANELQIFWKNGSFSPKNVWKSPRFWKKENILRKIGRNGTRLAKKKK